MQKKIEVGDKVRVINVPDEVIDNHEFQTRTTLKKCLGKIFSVTDLNGQLLALDVGEVNGKAPYLETIYIEDSCVEAVTE